MTENGAINTPFEKRNVATCNVPQGALLKAKFAATRQLAFSQGVRASPCSGTANAGHMRLLISGGKTVGIYCFEKSALVLPFG